MDEFHSSDYYSKAPGSRAIVIGTAIIALAIVLLAPACAAHANGSEPQNRPAATAGRAPSGQSAVVHKPSPGFSWSVRSKSTVITLVGSIHLGFEGLYPLPAPVEDAFRQSSALAMELALDQEPPEKVAELMISRALLPEGKGLRDYLSTNTWLQYQSFAKDHTEQALFFDRFRPWFVAVFLSSEKASVDGYDPNQGIDLHFYNQRGTRKVIGVEKAEQHIKALAELPEAVQDLMLAEQLDAMNQNDDEMQMLIKYWQKGDIAGLEQELFEEFKNPVYVPVYNALIVKRNVRMADQIERWLAGTERVFVVLGAAHFIGKDGIVARLERDGWVPERL